VRIELFDVGKQIETRTVGQHQIQEDNVDLLLAQYPLTVRGGRRLQILEAIALQE
jgi:hypothetical protein